MVRELVSWFGHPRETGLPLGVRTDEVIGETVRFGHQICDILMALDVEKGYALLPVRHPLDRIPGPPGPFCRAAIQRGCGVVPAGMGQRPRG